MKQKLLKRYQALPSTVKTSMWFTLCNFLQRGSACIVVPIFTRLLPPKEYGICNVYFALFDFFILFTSLKLPYEGLNNGLIRYEEDKDGYTSSILGLITVMTVIMAGVYLLFRPWIDAFCGLGGFLMAVMFVQLLCNPPLMLWTNRERFDFRYRLPAAVTLISTVANPTLAVLAVLYVTHTSNMQSAAEIGFIAEARILASAAVQTVFGILCAVILFWRGRCFYKREYWRFALGFNLPLLSYYISQSLLNQSDRIMINYYTGSGDAAIYSVAYSAGTLMLLLISAVNGSFNPWMYKKLKAKRSCDIVPTAAALCLIMGAATLAMMALAPDLVAILAAEDYRAAVWVIPPVAASVFFVFVYMMFANVEMYFGAVRGISVISVIAGAANVLLNAYFIPAMGYMAAGWTTLVCYALLALLHFMLARRACRQNQMQIREVFPKRTLLLVSAAVVCAAPLMLWIYTVPYLRYAVFISEMLLLFLFRKKIAAEWNTLKQREEGPHV